MRERLTLPLIILLGLSALACGGDDSEARQRTTPTWQARDRLPVVAQHWWGQPVERYCDDTTDCEAGQRCQRVRLSSCRDGCPRGEDALVCVPRDWHGDEALSYETPTAEDDAVDPSLEAGLSDPDEDDR